MALPWELWVQTPKLDCLQLSRVVWLARGRHTELLAIEPGAVHACNNSNKSQRQARPTCIRAQEMHPCCPATTTATLTSADMPAGCRAVRGMCSKCCSSPLSPDPLQTAPASTHTSKELAVHCFPLSCLLFAMAAGKHLSATLTPSTTDLKSITPEHRARLLLTETIKL